jgi:hypothetical protein
MEMVWHGEHNVKVGSEWRKPSFKALSPLLAPKTAYELAGKCSILYKKVNILKFDKIPIVFHCACSTKMYLWYIYRTYYPGFMVSCH